MESLPGLSDFFTTDTRQSAPQLAVLTIAGFDPSSGAGFTADLKVFAALGLFGLACPTAWTVQSTQGVRRSESCSPSLVTDILACLADDFEISGIKIGMLATEPSVESVTRWLSDHLRLHPGTPVVLDPVLRSSSGAVLLDTPGVAALRRGLLPLVSIITPNLDEAAILAETALKAPETSREQVETMARGIWEGMNSQRSVAAPAAGPAVVITGGHAGADETPDDYLLAPSVTGVAPRGTWFPGEWVRTSSTHGTGCAFSSALLCGLVHGLALDEAVAGAKAYVHAALRAAYPIGKGRGPLHHLFRLDEPAEKP